MNENEAPLEGATLPPDDDKIEETLAAIDATVEAGSQATADSAAEAEAAIETLAETATAQAAPLAEAEMDGEQPAVVAGLPVPVPVSASQESGAHRQQSGAHKQTLTDRLAEETEYDPEANNDDKLLAALAYASQMIIPVLVPVILLVSETSKKRPFQRYHAVQSLAAGIVIWALQLGLGTLSGIAAASLIGLLCLCFILPAMIVLWLLPLYYAILAYGGKRFRIPGLTQFLEDQRWL